MAALIIRSQDRYSGDPSDFRLRLSDRIEFVLSSRGLIRERLREARETLAPAGSGADIFGNRPKQPSVETIVCTNCGTALSTNRFAPHLERCMLGKGRASARQAREAMQNTL